MGVLEATLPLRPWAFPYSLFWLGVAARISGTKVALVSVGANVVSKRATRWFIVRAARLAHYRSYRDEQSRAAMQAMGVDVHADQVFPDLAFALPVPPSPVAASNAAVGIGLMAYYGGNDDRARAEQLHRAYVDTMRQFVRWLLDSGRQVRLFAGDRADEPVIAAILSDAQTYRARAGQVSAEPFRSMQEVLQQVASVDTVIASRYHNVLGALKLGKLTLSLGYAAKHDALMATMGLGAFSMSAAAIDLDELIGRFTALEAERDALEAILVERNRRQRQLVDRQFDALSTTLFPVAMGAAVTEATG
jgi:polysaccharide pyruvyl transferase WcaK-like protein